MNNVAKLRPPATNEFTVEQGVPMPSPMKGRPRIYPFGAMEIGDSFWVDPSAHRKVVRAASGYGPRNGKKFSIRKVDGGFRCWRVA